MEVNFTLDNIDKAAKEFLSATKNLTVFALSGEMGAGKTTFIHAVCKAMEVTDTISSPTFSIINQYKTASGKLIYHMDLYRLKNGEEALQAGVEDCLYSGNTCFIEWPDNAPGIFPEDTVYINIEATGSNIRKLKINL